MAIFIFRCCTWPILSGWQHRAMRNISSLCIFVLCVNATQVTLIDISHHRFRPCLCRPSLLSSAENRQVCDRFDTGRGPLYVAIPSESLADSEGPIKCPQCQVSGVIKLRVFCFCLWCHRSSISWLGHGGGATAVQGYLVLMFCYHGA